ncbi:MAG: Thioredoxin reductase, partial [uncultured Thermomicrobiales bacterium]
GGCTARRRWQRRGPAVLGGALPRAPAGVERERERCPGRCRRAAPSGHGAGPRLRRRRRCRLASPAWLAGDRRRRVHHRPRTGGDARRRGRRRGPDRLPAARPRPLLSGGRLRPRLRPVPALASGVSSRPRSASGGRRRGAGRPPVDRRARLGRAVVVEPRPGQALPDPARDAGRARPEPGAVGHRPPGGARTSGRRPQRGDRHRHRQRRRRSTPQAI